MSDRLLDPPITAGPPSATPAAAPAEGATVTTAAPPPQPLRSAPVSRPRATLARVQHLPVELAHQWDAAPVKRRIAITIGSVVGLILIVALVFVAIGLAASPSAASPGVKQVTVPAHQTYNAAAPAAPSGDSVNLTLEIKETLVSIAPGVAYNAWTFNGTVPGPVLRVRQGQMVNVTIVNHGQMPHSIDFHAAQTPWNVNYQPVAPGKSFSFSWRANVPGVFMYHCGTPPAMMHIANGMYGAIIVDPAQGWSPAKEYVLVQSEFYLHQIPDGSYTYDNDKAMATTPDYIVFNGYADQYKDAPLTAAPSQKIRLFIVNAGPSEFSAFHVIGAIFSDYYESGDPNNHMHSSQTLTIPPGGGMVAELTMPDSGSYPFVTHAFSSAMKGATGVIKVG